MNLDTQIKTTLTFEEARAASLSFRTVTLDRAQLNVQAIDAEVRAAEIQAELERIGMEQEALDYEWQFWQLAEFLGETVALVALVVRAS